MHIDATMLDALRVLAEAAGREIMEVYATDFDVTRKADDSPLTQADLRADAVIRQGLERLHPGVFILSEESLSSGDAGAQPLFLVDPLDGTKEFLQRNGEFTVNIALIVQGRPVAGVVHAPALATTYFGAAGLGAWKIQDGLRLPIVTVPPGERLRVIGSRSHGGEALARWLQALPGPHDFVAAGSSLKFCRVAEGAADVYPRLGPTSQWDTAAGQAVLEAAGGAVLDSDGRPMRYGPDRPLLNGNFVALARPDLPISLSGLV